MAEKGSEAVIQWWNFTSILYMLSNRGLGAAPAKLLCKNVLSLLGNIRGHSHNVNEPRPIVNTWIGSRWGSSSSTRWKSRQGKDIFAREARVQGLKSRAAFKLLEIDAKYKIFKKGQTVVDLGYAPGSWSQVAVERTKPTGRIIGIDVIPAQPPKGVSTIQGNFLSKEVQEEVKRFLSDPDRGRPRDQLLHSVPGRAQQEGLRSIRQESYIDMERHAVLDESSLSHGDKARSYSKNRIREKDEHGKMVDVVLSDMSAPWEQTTGFWKKSLSGPYNRMMNTSGINLKDHAGSMDLCAAALQFSYDTLRIGGHLVCKFYQGSEDKQLEAKLKKLFAVVHREKPESSRSESKEGYFVALRRKREVDHNEALPLL